MGRRCNNCGRWFYQGSHTYANCKYCRNNTIIINTDYSGLNDYRNSIRPAVVNTVTQAHKPVTTITKSTVVRHEPVMSSVSLVTTSQDYGAKTTVLRQYQTTSSIMDPLVDKSMIYPNMPRQQIRQSQVVPYPAQQQMLMMAPPQHPSSQPAVYEQLYPNSMNVGMPQVVPQNTPYPQQPPPPTLYVQQFQRQQVIPNNTPNSYPQKLESNVQYSNNMPPPPYPNSSSNYYSSQAMNNQPPYQQNFPPNPNMQEKQFYMNQQQPLPPINGPYYQ